MQKFMKWVEDKVVPPMAKIGTQRHLLAIRNGVVSTLSLILVGTFFMVFINLPVESWKNALAPYSATIILPFRLTMGLMAIYATFVMGQDLAHDKCRINWMALQGVFYHWVRSSCCRSLLAY